MLRTIPCLVTAVSSSQEACALLQDRPPVLILSDVVMPGLSGIDLLHRIHDNEDLRAVKVILMTVVPEQVGSADAALAYKVLTKPIQRTALELTIQDALDNVR